MHRSLASALTLALALAGPLGSLGCASTTTIEHVWRAPEWKGSFSHVAIFGMSKQEGVRRDFEANMVKAFANVGVDATASYELFPNLQGEPSREAIAKVLADKGIDGALVTRLVGVSTEAHYVDGTPYAVMGGPTPPDFYGHYQGSYQVVYSSDRVVEYEIVTIETNLYEVSSSNLIWSGLSETFAPDTIDDVIESYSQLMVGELAEAGLVTRTITPGAIEAHQ